MTLLLNVLIPGVGLILRGRHWLGFSLAMLFGLSANTAIAGWLVAPVAIPLFYTWTATVLTIASWILAQVLLLHRPTTPQRIDPVE